MTVLTLEHMLKQCQDFNTRYAVGDAIKFWTEPREGNPTQEGIIRFPAEVMGGHTPVVWVEGKGAIALSHVGGPA
jgi:hypothetical protein